MRVNRLLNEVRNDLQTGDLLLFRGRTLFSKVIKINTRSDYSHAAKIDRLGTELFCVEVRELRGGRIVTLESQIQRYAGDIDVYVTNPHNLPGYDRFGAAAYLRRFAGADYGYRAIWMAALVHLPIVRCYQHPNYELEDGEVPVRSPFCSQAVAMADRHGGGIDPVPNLPDRLTSPGDLSRSPFYQYAFTLIGV